MKTNKNRYKIGYRTTIYTSKPDLFTCFYIERMEDMTYKALCHMSGCGTDILGHGSLAQCYKTLLPYIRHIII